MTVANPTQHADARLPAFALRATARPRRSSVEIGRSGGGKPDTTDIQAPRSPRSLRSDLCADRLAPDRDSAQRGIGRRDFIRGAAALGAGGLCASTVLDALAANPALSAQAGAARAAAQGLDLAEWSYFWVGVEQAHLARGTVVNGKQMYVEYWIPAQARHPYAMVLVHGGGGQGTDWMGTPDGRPGWLTCLLQA